jgi:hypothetical protein
MLRAPSGIEEEFLTADWRLEASPNPVGKMTDLHLRWHAPEGTLGEEVQLMILDAAGRRLFRETMGVSHTGWNDWRGEWLAKDGPRLPAGVYFAWLQTPARAIRAKIVLTR